MSVVTVSRATAGRPARRRPWHGLRPLERAAAVVLAAIVVMAVAGPLLAPYDPTLQRFADGILQPPLSAGHLLGTDQLARDLLSRLMAGARTSLAIAGGATLMGLVTGVLIGVVAGFRGGVADTVLMRVMDAMLAFPALVLALVIAASLGPNGRNTAIAIAVVQVPGFARVARSLTLRERERDYVNAARVAGASATRIVRVHVIPNVWGPIAAQAVLALGHAVPSEAALSFLGLGVQPPTPSWGNMIAEGYQYIDKSAWPMVLPAICIVLTVGSISLLADAARRRSQEG
jgi:ABC-type dipeptide/oligopeptide/nickel transport system permease subunit